MANKDRPFIVIVDDDPIYLKMWEKIFQSLPNCHYSITNDPKAALQLVRSRKVDLVISDIVMPEVDGYEIAAATQKAHLNAEIILTTAYSCELSRFDLNNPRFHIIYKPYKDINDIQRFITHLLLQENLYDDMSEDSYSENDVYPQVMEWKL